MKYLLIFISFILLPKVSFGQELLWQSVNQEGKYKYEYCFSFEQKEDTIITIQKVDYPLIIEKTIYQINSKKELSLSELTLIMNCVKRTIDKSGYTHSYKCSKKNQYYVSMQI